MNSGLYSKSIKCPICNNTFNSLKVKKSASIVTKKDEDFCTYYKELNPLFYEIFVCPNCGYGASENSFNDISEPDRRLLREAFSGRVIGRSFCGERTIYDAIDSFKIALYTSKLISAKDSTVAGICLKIAWLYRFLNERENEKKFMNFAYNYYIEAFNKENFPIGNLSGMSIMYLLGELSRRLGKLEESIGWFSKAVANPERIQNPRIERLAREQWYIAKEEFKKLKDII